MKRSKAAFGLASLSAVVRAVEVDSLLEETNASGVALADYIYLNGRPVAVLNGSTLYYLHDDRLGTPQLATDSNQPTGYTYDPSGNMTVEPVSPPNQMTYDGENRMTAFQGIGGAASYSYDGNGMRVVKSTWGGATTVSIFSGSSVIAEYDNGAPPSSPSREYIAGPTGLLAMISDGTTTYFHQDDKSVRLTTDANGNVLTQEGHFPFGEPWYQSGTTNQWFFTSYDRDSESGLDYALARYYDSRTGTFCSADPLAGDPSDPQSWNRYPYGRNDPIDVTDPSGKNWLSSLLIDIGIGVGVALLPELAPAWFGAGTAGATIGTTQGLMFSADGTFIGATQGAVYTWGSSTLATEAIGGGLAGAEFKYANASTEGPQQDIINNRLKDLAQRLPNDKPCNDFLNSAGTNAQQILNDSMKYNAIGHADITENGSPVTNAAVSNGLVPGQATTINNQGAFFHPTTAAGQTMTIGPRGFAGGSPRAQAAIMLHELGHLTNVLRPDAGNAKAVRANDKDIDTHCAGTINGAR